jgi:hypothetical protein
MNIGTDYVSRKLFKIPTPFLSPHIAEHSIPFHLKPLRVHAAATPRAKTCPEYSLITLNVVVVVVIM